MAAFVRRVTVRNRLPLDYSVASLRVVDRIVDGLRTAGPERANVAQELFWLGAYVGEVFVRRAGAVWVDFDAGQREFFRQAVGVRMPDGRVWNPIGKVAKRFDVGVEESVQRMYLLLHGRAGTGRREPEAVLTVVRKPETLRHVARPTAPVPQEECHHDDPSPPHRFR
ncbi:hypothetical protein [Streptomyces sp. NBC_01465]|uniref:hypothetical protein n=1 Tax=Streptomyces sp. NBC_01465 TaxID=2903878 RepID=UPI002E37F4B7|nr:hypothetical protein [Streptomyces sp. NBC_01465]